MQSTNQKQIDLEALPEEARKELLDFYEFLLNKYCKETLKQKRDSLKTVLCNPTGILPKDYRFNREEAHER